LLINYFYFSSRRRHTRFSRDWSSDVCSSDLMAGNNSCGSRSIAYGNMVHNVLGLRAWMADGELLRFGPVAQASGRTARIAEFVQIGRASCREEWRSLCAHGH